MALSQKEKENKVISYLYSRLIHRNWCAARTVSLNVMYIMLHSSTKIQVTIGTQQIKRISGYSIRTVQYENRNVHQEEKRERIPHPQPSQPLRTRCDYKIIRSSNMNEP